MSETYYSLTPSVLEKEEYYEALNWAINNKDTTNIAVTGDYGSGKSSVVHSFVTNKENDTPKFKFFKKNPEFKSLKISLATFSSGKSSSQNVDNTEESQESTETNKLDKAKVDSADSELSKDEILELEQAILKHMFYQLDANELPHSRFNQITPPSKSKKILKSALISFLCSLIFLYVQPEALGTDIGNLIPKHLLAMLAFLGMSGLVYQVILMASSSQLKKFGVIRGEVEFTDKTSDSIFHQYLEEIIYFFEGTKYDLVIFEDLDRFQRSPELFTAIREINQLLNKRKKINNTLNFIYVVRDDLFSNVKRTKFFDYILPIVPIISASNAHDIFESLLKESTLLDNSDEFKDLIKDITYGLTDLRLIKNIINEYKIYSKKLNAVNDNDGKFELLPHKLLAVIIYKNLMPKDFTELRNHQGILARIFYDKQKYIQKLRSELTTKIEAIETDIANSDNENLESVNELAQLVISKIPRGWIDISDQSNSNNLNSLSAEGLEYYSELQNYSLSDKRRDSTSNMTKGCSLKQHMNEINYEQRKALIENKSDTQRALLINKKNTLTQERSELTNALPLKDIYQSNNEFTLVDENIKHSELMNYLLQNGYIAEDYANYLSYFYGEGVYDQKFIQSVLYNKPKDFDYQFDSFDNVINSLNGKKFNSPGVLNSKLLQGLLDKEHPKLDDFLLGLISGLKTKNEAHINFFKEKIIYEALLTKLTPKLLQLDPKLPYFLLTSPEFSSMQRDILVQTLRKIDKSYYEDDKLKQVYKKLIESDCSLLIDFDIEFEGIGNEVVDKQLMFIFKTLEIEYPIISPDKLELPIQRFIVKNGFYSMNYQNLKWAYQISGGTDLDSFESDNYRAITNFEIPHRSISEKLGNSSVLDSYIKIIYPLLEKQNIEPSAALKLLNNSELKLNSKKIIIDRQIKPFIFIQEVINKELWHSLMHNKLVMPNWHNVINYYLHFGQLDYLDNESNSEPLIEFLNTPDVYQALGVKEITDIDDSVICEFLVQCLYSKTLKLKAFKAFYIRGISLNIEDIKNIELSKLAYLIQDNYMQFTIELFEELKHIYPGHDFHIELIIRNTKESIKHIQEIEVSADDILKILNSKTDLDNEFINRLLSIAIDKITITNQEEFLNKYISKIIRYAYSSLLQLNLSERDLHDLFESKLNSDSKLELLIINLTNLKENELAIILPLIDQEYSKLSLPKKRPKLAKNKLNEDLLSTLKEQKKLITTFTTHDDNYFKVNMKKAFR